MSACLAATATCSAPRTRRSTACRAPRTRRVTLSHRTTTVAAVAAAMIVSATGAAPTPLYPIYQQAFGLSMPVLTVVFAVYVFSLLAALLTVGTLSDYVGRRPAILAALAMNMIALALFVTAGSAGALIAARALQGLATGLAAATLGATILDTDGRRGPVLNSITAFLGLSIGSIGAGALVTWAPEPRRLVFAVLLALSAAAAATLWHMPETAPGKPGALAALRPRVRVPTPARGPLARIAPLTIASWALGGFYFSMMPSLVRAATGLHQPVVGGLVVGALMLSAALAVLALRGVAAQRLIGIGIAGLATGVAVTVAGVYGHAVTAMLVGTIVSGAGFGAALSATMRTVMPLAAPNERAGLLAAFYVEGYLSFSVPALIAGAVTPAVGLVPVAELYGLAVALAALACLPSAVRRLHDATPAHHL